MAQGSNRQPRRGDAVWVEGRDGANGYIIAIDYDTDPIEYTVLFHDNKGRETYVLEDMEWTDKYGGQWNVTSG